jgi:GDP-L-fucose synthase
MSSADAFRDDRILVTGAGGVLGTALVGHLSSQPHQAALFLRRQDCDLLDKAATEKIWKDFRPTLVFHLAGWVAGIQGNISFAGRAFYDNTVMGLNVIEATRVAGARKIVAAGTAAVYSDHVPLPMREAEVWNGSPHGSERAYGQAKRAMLAHLQAYQAQYGCEFAYMICTNLYGQNDRFDTTYGHVVPSLVARFHQAVREDLPSITIWGDGTPTRDFLYAGDAAEGFACAARGSGGVYNLATGVAVSIRELVDTLAEVSGFRGEIVWDSSRPNGQLRRSYDIKAISALGWKPRHSLRDGLRLTWRWYSQNHEFARR